MATLTELATAARVLRTAVKDKSYEDSPLGGLVARYLHWKEVEARATPRTLRDYEATLARLAVYYADRDPVTLEREAIRDFWYATWKGADPNTMRKVLSHMRDFFRWATDDAGVYEKPPTQGIRSPQRRESEIAELITPDEQDRLFTHNSATREQAALSLLFDLGLRKSALRLFRLGDYDQARGMGRFQWKGEKTHDLPIMLGLAQRLDLHIDERMAQAAAEDRDYRREYLLYPRKVGLSWNPDLPRLRVLWEDRLKPLSGTAMHNWWARCLENADLPHTRLHNARHTGLTDFYVSTRDLLLTQQLAGHKSSATTERYTHLAATDLADAMRRRYEGA